jgi:EAL and modified HD-GYP domain-containing signal transduction protein
MVGRQQIRAWASLLLLSTFGDKPKELIVTAMVRGKMAELLARALKVPNVDSYFTVGMFSVLDALLDLPMAEAIHLLPFSDAVRSALLRQEGAMGSMLRAVTAYEVGNWRGAKCEDLSFGVIRDCYLEAVSFAWELTRLHG